MAKAEKKSNPKVESIRQRVERLSEEKPSKKSDAKSHKLRISKAKKDSAKTRRFHLTPRFIREAFLELKGVTWPNSRETTKLTTAVILFSVIFSIMVSAVDYVFSIIFKKVFLHG